MPENTPQNKVDRTEYFGGSFVEVHLAGRTFDDAYAASVQFQQKRDAVFVHPFDDAAVIAGQGTLGIEIAEQVSPDMLVAPVGGGGLLSGVGIAVRDKYPEVELYGAEPAGAASLRHALNLGRVAALQEIDTFVDGAAVKQEGEQTFAILSQLGVQSVGVANEQTRRAVTDHWEQDGLRVELAGGLATAALEQLPREQKIGKTIVLIASGGCLSLDRYEAEVKLQ